MNHVDKSPSTLSSQYGIANLSSLDQNVTSSMMTDDYHWSRTKMVGGAMARLTRFQVRMGQRDSYSHNATQRIGHAHHSSKDSSKTCTPAQAP